MDAKTDRERTIMARQARITETEDKTQVAAYGSRSSQGQVITGLVGADLRSGPRP